MGMSVGSGDEDAPMMDMNTTPLIDVMLVMLIMFIITIPIQTHAVKIDLPVPQDNQNKPEIDPIKNKIVVTADNGILWNGTPVDLATLAGNLQQSMQLTPEPELQIQPDPAARYVTVDYVLAEVKKANVTKIGFVGNEQYARAF